jgi:hypothetical protein
MNVAQIYDSEDAPVEMKIELEREAASVGGLTARGFWRRSISRLKQTALWLDHFTRRG